jgi:DNA-binding NarL/FixJ family response regulator
MTDAPKAAPASPANRSAARVLIVEDQFMSALALVQAVEEIGVRVVGPAPTVQEALRLIDEVSCDAALLDVNLGTETVEPVAQRLADLGRPFVFVTGYTSPKLKDPRFKSRRIIPKPVDTGVLKTVMQTEFGI